MPDCPSNDRLLLMLEQALNQTEQTEVAIHVDHCARCQQTLDGLTGADPFLDRPAPGATVGVPRPAASPASADRFAFLSPPQKADELGRLADYRVLELLGQGGMGMVFRAEDSQLRRLVALKVMHGPIADDSTGRERFLREARAIAALKNEHVVTVHQVGEANGVRFLTMELLEGESLEGRLDREGKLPLTEVLRIGRETAEGLAAAHARGLVHRDVKPANLWLEAPHGRIKLLDFGLVWTAQEQMLTQSGYAVGTPSFMSPEQARADVIDARGDLFSLGCVLYRLVSGVPPFRGTTATATLLAIANDTPAPPHALNPTVPVALSDLILRLLAKKPEDRPQSAGETARTLAALERCGPATAVTPAGPPRSERSRRPRVLVAVGMIALLLVGAGVLLPQFWNHPRETTPSTEAPLVRDLPPKLPAPGPLAQLRASDVTEEQRIVAGGGDPRLAPAGLVAVLGDGRMQHWQAIDCVCFSPDGQTLGSASSDGAIMLWDLRTGLGRCVKTDVGSGQVVFDPTWIRCFWANDAGPWKSWAVPDGKEMPVFHRMTGPARPLRFSANGRWLAAGRSDAVDVWDLVAGQWKHSFAGHRRGASTLAFDPAGKRLAVAQADNTAKVWNLETGVVETTVPVHPALISALAFSPDGKTLATGTADAGAGNEVRLWDAATGQPQGVLLAQAPPIPGIYFSSDGQTVVLPNDRTTFWDRQSGKQVGPVLGRGPAVYRVGGSADGRTLALGDMYGKIALIDIDKRQERPVPLGSVSPSLNFAFRQDDTLLADLNHLGEIRLWDGASGRLVQRHQAASTIENNGLAFQPNGSLLAVASGNAVQLWDTVQGKQVVTFPPPGDRLEAIAFHPDGRAVAAVGGDNKVFLWDVRYPQEPPRTIGLKGSWGWPRPVFHPDGQRLAMMIRKATAPPQFAVELIDLATGKTVQSFPTPRGTAFALSTDGKWLATTESKAVVQWDMTSGKEVRRFPQEPSPNWVAFSPNGRMLAASGLDGKIHLWDPEAASDATALLQTLTVTPVRGRSIFAFSADGRHLITRNLNGTFYVLRLDGSR